MILLVLGSGPWLSACGGPQPTGDVSSCTGKASIAEANETTSTVTVSSSQSVGQHFGIYSGMTVKSIMILADTSGASGLKVSFYQMSVDSFPEYNQPFKEFTLTSGLGGSGMKQRWIDLPESLDLPASTTPYFIALSPTLGSLSVGLGVRTASSFRIAYRGFTVGGEWDLADTSHSLSLGFAGDSDCKGSY